MTPTLARQRAVDPRQRGYFDGLMGRPEEWRHELQCPYSLDCVICEYSDGYQLGAAALDPSEGR